MNVVAGCGVNANSAKVKVYCLQIKTVGAILIALSVKGVAQTAPTTGGVGGINNGFI